MPVDAPPAPPAQERPTPDEQEALIKEARRRARRRRLRYLGVVLAAAAAVASAVFAFGHNSGQTVHAQEPHSSPVSSWPTSVSRAWKSAGNLTVIAVPPGSPPTSNTLGDGWYGLSWIDVRGRLQHLVRCPAGVVWCGEVEGIAWSPGGRWLALSVTSFHAANPYNGIHVIDLQRRTDTQIRSCRPAECGWFDLHWSGDSARLAYVSEGRIYLIRRSGSGGPVLLRTGLRGALSSPSWSPVNDRIVFAARPSRHDRAAIYSIRPDGSDRRLLASGASVPAWSPDGRTIAFASKCGNGIKLMTPAGVDVTPGVGPCRVIGVPGLPTWSPDGERLAIASPRGNWLYRRPGIYVVGARGTGLRLLTAETTARGVTSRGLSWQPPVGISNPGR